MKLVRTLSLVAVVAALSACAVTGRRPTESAASDTAEPPAPSSSAVADASPTQAAEPETITIDELTNDPEAYDGRDVVLTAVAVSEVAPSAWLVAGTEDSDATVLMLNNALHPVAITAGESLEIHGTIERYTDPASMTEEVGALPDMFARAFAPYQGSESWWPPSS
jgi:hypothetical protein